MSYDFNSLEICIIQDGLKPTIREDNLIWGTLPPTEFKSKFFQAAYELSSAPWIFLANDDIEIKTKHWDRMFDLSDPWRLYHFRDGWFNHTFGCHPLTSRKVWELMAREGLVFPPFRNMGCDTTIWDVMPHLKRFYMPNIELVHNREYDQKKRDEMKEDYKYYDLFAAKREAVHNQIVKECGMSDVKLLIGLSTGEHIRKADFLPFFLGLEKPTNCLLTTVHGQSPAQARNIIIRQALSADCTHIFFTDDDMALPPDTITKLLRHDKDIVMGLYLMRSYPHFPTAFDLELPNGFNKFLYLLPEVNGLIPITNGGLGCVLMKTEVFKKMEDPWITLGELQRDGWCDDVSFYNRARKAGFEVWLDTDALVGHMMSVNIWPTRAADGSWYTSYRHVNGEVLFPQTIPSPEQTKEELEKHATPELVVGPS